MSKTSNGKAKRKLRVQRVVRTRKAITLTEHMRRCKAVFLKSNHRWKKDEDGKIDWFAAAGGYHNGPECAACGYSKCVHCNCGDKIPKCPNAEVRHSADSASKGSR